MHDALDSALLRRWASGISELALHEDCFSRPDISNFLAGAANLRKVQLWCHNVISAAQAERALSGCAQIDHLEAYGSQILNRIPAHLKYLSITFEEEHEEQVVAPLLPSVLLYKLASMSQLLELKLFILTDQVQLDCPLQCAGLQQITLWFDLYDETVTYLSWLGAQPACTRLDISIRVCTAKPEVHSELTEQLQQLRVTKLSLWFCVPFPLAVQEVWQKVAVSSHCRLGFSDVCPAEATIQLLPCSPEFLIDLTQVCLSRGPVTLAGAALTSQAAKFCIRVALSRCLTILGGCETPVELADQPWQVVVQGALSVEGLYDSRESDGWPYLQNTAAAVAGWTP